MIMLKTRFITGLLLLFSILTVSASIANASPSGRLQGKVVDPLGAAVPGAEVSLLRDGKPVSTTKTESDGSFTFAPVEVGAYVLQVTARGLAVHEDSVTVAERTAEIDVVLQVGTLRQQIVVSDTGTSLPESQVGASVTVLDQAQLDAFNQSDLFESLRQVPGFAIVQTGQRGGATSIFARGGTSQFNKVLVDGIPANDIGGAFEFANLSSSGVSQVEVLRGANSVLYGTDALGSVIQISTRRGSTPLPEFTYSIDGGNFNTLRQDVSVGGVFRRFDYFADFMRFDTQNGVPNSSFHNGTFAGNFGWRAKPNTDVRFTVRHTAAAFGISNALNLYGIPDGGAQWDQDTYMGIKAQNQTTAKWRNSVQLTSSNLRYSYDDAAPQGIPFEGNYLGEPVTICGANGYCTGGQAILDYGGTYPSLYNSHTSVQTLYALSNYNFTPEIAANAGFWYDHEGGYTNSAGFLTPAHRNNFGSFLEAHGNLGHRAFATAGVGLDDNAVYGFAATPRVSVAYYALRPVAGAFFNGTKLRFNFGTGINEPSILNQSESLYSLLTSLPNGPQLAAQYHLAPIGPERSRDFDAGVEQYLLGGRARLALTGFHENYSDLISYVSNNLLPQLGVPGPVAAAVPYGATVNSDSFRSQGAEVELEAKLRRDLRFQAEYTYTDAVVSKSFASSAQAPAFNPAFPNIAIGIYSPLIGGRPFGVPRNSGSMAVIYSRRRFGMSATGYFVSRSDDSTFLSDEFYGYSMLLPNRNLLNAYQLVDWSGWYDVHRGVTLYSSVGNLLSEHYQGAFGYPALPFNFRAGVKFTIGGEAWKRK